MNESEKIEKEMWNNMSRNIEECKKRGDFTYQSEDFKETIYKLLARAAIETRNKQEEKSKIKKELTETLGSEPRFQIAPLDLSYDMPDIYKSSKK
jgi:hypothetical protein